MNQNHVSKKGTGLLIWGIEKNINQGEDLCSEVTIRWVSMGGSAWGWGRLQGRGSLFLLTPAAWISRQGVEAVCSPSSSSCLVWFSFWICIWGSRGGVGDGLGDSLGGVSRLGTSFGLLHHPFTSKISNNDRRMTTTWRSWDTGHTWWGKSRFTQEVKGSKRENTMRDAKGRRWRKKKQ